MTSGRQWPSEAVRRMAEAEGLWKRDGGKGEQVTCKPTCPVCNHEPMVVVMCKDGKYYRVMEPVGAEIERLVRELEESHAENTRLRATVDTLLERVSK